MIMTDKIEETVMKEQVSLKVNPKVIENFRLEVQKKFGKTHSHLGESLEVALVEWTEKQRLIRKQKKEMSKNNDSE